jgi:hypothetical protein
VDKLLKAGLADLFAFGRPFIANPDLPYRLRNNLPLATISNPATLLAEAAQAIPIIRSTKPTRRKVMAKKTLIIGGSFRHWLCRGWRSG